MVATRNQKRRLTVETKDNEVLSKRPRLDDTVLLQLKDESVPDCCDERRNDCETIEYENTVPYRLLGQMYQLDLSVLCLLRKVTYSHKYPSLSVAFENSATDNSSNIMLRYENKTVCIETEIVDKHSNDNDISYTGLFTNATRSFYINNLLNNFIKHKISELYDEPSFLEYLVIYTNADMGLTEEKKLKEEQNKTFYPFQIADFDMEESDILKDLLFTNNNTNERHCYKFAQDVTTSEELAKRLQISPDFENVLKEMKLSQKEIKREFINKLVFAVNQPSREDLHVIVTNEIEGSGVGLFYKDLQARMLDASISSVKHKKLRNGTSGLFYNLNLFILFLHEMFSNGNMISIKPKTTNEGKPNGIAIQYKNTITCVSTHTADSSINYEDLFRSREPGEQHTLNKYFSLFVDEFKNNIKYFIIFTNADLDLTEGKLLTEEGNIDSDPLKFYNINIKKNKYNILRDCSWINENGLYRFSRKGTIRRQLLSLLELPPSLQKKNGRAKYSGEYTKEIKEKFLNKLIFAVNQPDRVDLTRVITYSIVKQEGCTQVPYNYEELFEVALRWLESHKSSPITKEIMESLLRDIQNNSHKVLEYNNVDEVVNFAHSIVGKKPGLNQFIEFLTIGEGKLCMMILKINGVKLSNMSTILSGAGAKASQAFKELYNLWFDVKGNKSLYLKTLDREGINLSSILRGAGAKSAKAFQNLFHLWFNAKGTKTKYLKILEKEGIKLSNISSMLSGAGSKAPGAFKSLYDLWFDPKGNKSQYLISLEKQEIVMSNISSIISGAGSKASKAFKELYDIWFDLSGNTTQYLKTLQIEEVNISNISSILCRAGSKAPDAFKDLYGLWFDVNDKKTPYLLLLEKRGIKLSNISSILSGAGAKAPRAFKELYDLWFDQEGHATQYLKSLEEEQISVVTISNMLNGVGANAARAFTDLYDLWFDVKGNKTPYLATLENEGVKLITIASILQRTKTNATKAFKDLYDLWFTRKRNKTQFLKTLEQVGISLRYIASILCGAGSKAPKAFKELYSLWFNIKGKKTQCLKVLERENINFIVISSIFNGVGSGAAKAFKNLYDLWFDAEGNKTLYLIKFEAEGIQIANLASILHRARTDAAKSFLDLYNLWFDRKGNKTQYLRGLEKEGVMLTNIFSVLSAAGAKGPKTFTALYDSWFDDKGCKKQCVTTLEKRKINLSNISIILSGAGFKAPKTFKDLYELWFDEKGSETIYLNTLENEGVNLLIICSILSKAGAKAPNTFTDLYDSWFDAKGNKTKNVKNLEKENVFLSTICGILNGSGHKAPTVFTDLYNFWFDENGNKTPYLKALEEDGINLLSISRTLQGAGASAVKSFNDLHDLRM